MKQIEEQKQVLVQCPECRTHVKMNDEQVCPFCTTSLALAPGSGAMQGIRRSLSKRSSFLMASLFGLSALGGVAVQGCDSGKPATENAAEKSSADGGTKDAVAPTDGGTAVDTATKPDNQRQDVPVLPPYGIPPD